MPCSLLRTALCAVLVTAAEVGAAPLAAAGQAEASHTHTGVIISVDPKERVLWVSGWLSKKEFNIDDHCTYSFSYTVLNNSAGTAQDLRPGEKVAVSYQDWHGMRIARRIEQEPMRLTGTVKKIQAGGHTLVLNRWLCNQRVAIAPQCIFLGSNDHVGTVADIHPGDHVTVTYETPHGRLTAMEIAKLQ